MINTLWRCEQIRAGQVYNKVMFNTQREAEQFVRQMNKVEPDLFLEDGAGTHGSGLELGTMNGIGNAQRGT